MIDLHFHVLPSLDDGPPDLESAVALVRAAADAGVDAIVATPHVNWHWQNSAETIAAALRQLTDELTARSLRVRIHPGAEIALTRAFELPDSELRALRLGAGPWVLIEPPHARGAGPVEKLLDAIAQRGHRIVLAHVERCPDFLDQPELLGRLVRSGMLASITAGSLTGRLGRDAQRAARSFIAAGLIHNVASDAHDTRTRPPGVLAALAANGLGAQAPWLTQLVPAAILRGAAIPPAPNWPEPPVRRRRLPRLR